MLDRHIALANRVCLSTERVFYAILSSCPCRRAVKLSSPIKASSGIGFLASRRERRNQ